MAFKDALKNAKKKAPKGKSAPKGKASAKKGGEAKKGMGFKAAVANAQKNSKGKMSKDETAAAVASASRNASPAAKKKNPNLKKVK